MTLPRRDAAEARRAPSPVRPHVVFTSGGVPFAFDAAHARHVLRAAAGDEVRFLDQPYPLVDVRRAFGHPAGDAGFVVLVESRGRAGLQVDELRGIAAIDPGALAPLPAVYRGTERRWIAGLHPTDDGVTVVVRVAELLETLGAVP